MTLTQDTTTDAPSPNFPALPDELERVRLDLAIARQERASAELRARITAEEGRQQALQRQIDDRIGRLRQDVERITVEIQRLEARLERLSFARRALSDHELDHEEQTERAEEAAFWAEWRQQRDERQGTVVTTRPKADPDTTLRQVYLALARLIHPDLAQDAADRTRREAVMRLANAANEAGDVDQLRRLLAIWSKPDTQAAVRTIATLRARLTERQLEHSELERELVALEAGTLGRMVRRPKAELTRYIKREEERLRRDMATLRLRRRRLLSSLEDRRRRLTEVSD